MALHYFKKAIIIFQVIKGGTIMAIFSYALASMSGILFVTGMAILFGGKKE